MRMMRCVCVRLAAYPLLPIAAPVRTDAQSWAHPHVVNAMAKQVVNGALLKCSFGVAPSSLVVPPVNMENSSQQPAANIMDHKPMVNVMPFGMCSSLANPTVASATSAAAGVLTPQACIPNTSSPWMPGSPTVLLKNQPCLNDSSTCMCMWGGVITVGFAGQTTHEIP